jgi:hypothetical protein
MLGEAKLFGRENRRPPGTPVSPRCLASTNPGAQSVSRQTVEVPSFVVAGELKGRDHERPRLPYESTACSPLGFWCRWVVAILF